MHEHNIPHSPARQIDGRGHPFSKEDLLELVDGIGSLRRAQAKHRGSAPKE